MNSKPMILKENQPVVFLLCACMVAIFTISSCSDATKGSEKKEMVNWINGESIADTEHENIAEENRSWYLPNNEKFSLRYINKGANPVGVLYIGFKKEIKVQVFNEYLSVAFEEGDITFRVYKNCTVEFIE